MTNRKRIDPERRAMPSEAWPRVDQELWSAACAQGEIFDGRGPAARWAEATRVARGQAYGRWLTHLAGHDDLDPAICPGDRVTPKSIEAYVVILRQQCAPLSVWSQVDKLYAMLSVALAPDKDWSWLRRIVNRLHAASVPVRLIEPRLRSSRELFAEGLDRMRMAETCPHLSPTTRAVAYRDGLMIALLTACPLRRRTLAGLELDRHLVQLSGHYFLRLEPKDLKNATALDFPVPEALTLLRFLPQPSARVVWKVLRSAAANAENNFNLNPDALVIRTAVAGDGKTLRRFKARSRGRASPRLRRRSNIEIVVEGDEGY